MSINPDKSQPAKTLLGGLKSSSTLVGAVLGLCLLVWFAPLLLAGKALYWGTPALQFIPWWHWAAETLAAGRLPLWNPLLGMGAPLLANYQSALLYPPTWFMLLADHLGGPALAAWLLAPWLGLHLVFSGIGMARLGERLGMNLFARLVCALTWTLSGYLTTAHQFPLHHRYCRLAALASAAVDASRGIFQPE